MVEAVCPCSRGSQAGNFRTAAEAKAYPRTIDNNRRLERTTREMRDLSLRILEAAPHAVKKRNPGTWKRLRLGKSHSMVSPETDRIQI